MKVHLIKRQSIEGYVYRNTQSKEPFGIWLSIIIRAEWNVANDIIATFNSTDRKGLYLI